MDRWKLSFSCVLTCLVCFGIVACGGDDRGDVSGDISGAIVGAWIARGGGSEFSATFDSDGKYIMTENGSIDSRGTYRVEGNIVYLNDEGGDVGTWVVSVSGDVMIVDFEGEEDTFDRVN